MGRKGQVAVIPANDMRIQASFITILFGVAV